MLRSCSGSMSDGCAAADLLDNGIDKKDLHTEPDWGQLDTQKAGNLRCREKDIFYLGKTHDKALRLPMNLT